MQSTTIVTTILFVSGLILLSGCDEEASQPSTGFISVSVTDGTSQDPVADVEIEVAPVTLVLRTDKDGMAVFEVAPGDYFVNAEVCCEGPGFLEYHVPAAVAAGERIEVNLYACLACL